MKVELTPKLTNQKKKIKLPKNNFLSNVKLFFTSKTPPLKNDSFEKDNQEKVERLTSRKEPNWCQTEYDPPNRTFAQTICYYPEDVEKMEQMTKKEMIAYKNKLYAEGKYYIDNNTGSIKELEEFLQSCGKTLDDVLIKDE